MANTIEHSLRSILEQVDKRFEVLVIDDGSTDGSISILERLESEFDSLRLIISNNENIGQARAEAVSKARGEYVLPQIDADDVYKPIILDFTNLYHQIERQVNYQFFLKGRSLNMAPTQLLQRIPYRSLGYGEDKDLWRRLFASDSVIWFNHNSPCRSIGYNRGFYDRVKITYEITRTQFRSGIQFHSFINHKIRNISVRSILQLLASPIAFIDAINQERFDLPGEYEKMGVLQRRIEETSRSLKELEQEMQLTINQAQFSETGRQILCKE